VTPPPVRHLFDQRGDGVVEGWATGALDFARTEKRLGTVPIIEHQNVGLLWADIKMRIEACRYLTWKACHDFDHTTGWLRRSVSSDAGVRPVRGHDPGASVGAGGPGSVV
jgi:alkylation response protein AidB-like acyl-CoA dehydrogenase